MFIYGSSNFQHTVIILIVQGNTYVAGTCFLQTLRMCMQVELQCKYLLCSEFSLHKYACLTKTPLMAYSKMFLRKPAKFQHTEKLHTNGSFYINKCRKLSPV